MEIDSSSCKWMAYGDSVVFHYNVQTGILEHSFTKLADLVILQDLSVAKTLWKRKAFVVGIFSI